MCVIIANASTYRKKLVMATDCEDLRSLFLKTCKMEMFAKHALKVIEEYGRQHESEYAHH